MGLTGSGIVPLGSQNAANGIPLATAHRRLSIITTFMPRFCLFRAFSCCWIFRLRYLSRVAP